MIRYDCFEWLAPLMTDETRGDLAERSESRMGASVEARGRPESRVPWAMRWR